MDNRIGVFGGIPPQVTVSGYPLPAKPYPTTISLDNEHYVVVDSHPTVNIDEVILVLRGMLSDVDAPVAPVVVDADEVTDDAE